MTLLIGVPEIRGTTRKTRPVHWRQGGVSIEGASELPGAKATINDVIGA